MVSGRLLFLAVVILTAVDVLAVLMQAYKLTQQELQCGSLEDGVVAKMAAREC